MAQTKVFRVGDAEICRIDDLTLDHFTPASFFPSWVDRSSRLSALASDTLALDGRHLQLHVHSWLIRHCGRIILVDTGAGNHKERPYARYFHHIETSFLKNLA